MIVIPKIFTDALSLTTESSVSISLDGEKLIVKVAKEND